MRLAQFRRTLDGSGYSYTTILTEKEAALSIYAKEYTRVSEFVEVEFPPRSAEEHVPEQLAVLDTAESELRSKFAAKLAEISSERAKLRALTHEVRS